MQKYIIYMEMRRDLLTPHCFWSGKFGVHGAGKGDSGSDTYGLFYRVMDVFDCF